MQLLPPPGSHPSPLLSSHTCPTIPSSPPAPPLLCHHCSQIQAAWRTDEIRRRKPTPQDESREGLTYFHETIFAGLPVFLRRIDTALKNIGQPTLPLTAKLFSFGAWIAMQLLMRRPEVQGFVAVAPPVNKYDFSFLSPCPSSGLIVQGDADSVVQEDSVSKLVQKFSKQKGTPIEYSMITGADHYFRTRMDEMNVSIEDYLRKRAEAKEVLLANS